METAMPHASSASDIITLSSEIQSAVGENLHSSNTHPLNRTTSAPPLGAEGPLLGKNQENKSDYNEKETNKLRKLIKDDLQFIDDASKNLEKYKAEVKKQLEDAEKLLQGDTDTEKMEPEEFSKDQLFELRKHVMKLKTEIPSKVKVRYSETTAEDAKRKEKPIRQVIMGEKKEHLAEVPSFYKKNKFESDEIFKQFEASFKLLNLQHKLCLLCFAVFPENATIKKRLLMYWWIGEGFIRSDEKPEDATEEVLNELMLGNFIEPVYDKCPFKEKVDSYKLQPVARPAVIMLAERKKFFNFDGNGNPMKEHIGSLRSCLLKEKKPQTKESQGPDNKNNSETKSCFPVLAKKSGNTQKSSEKPMAHVVFNLSETFIRLTPEWFTEMKHVNILYLGKWESTAKLHIEVEEPDVLKGLADLKYVKFLSLQGISGITEIPDSISKLWNLRVLDLRACHNLEVIPQGIGSLYNLTHLDISECYLLSRMPKDLSKLRNLVVLKGFEVQDTTDKQSCTLEDLLDMTKLGKLSIHTEIEDFPTETDLDVLKDFEQLRILTIEWGGNLLRKKEMQAAAAKSRARSGGKAAQKKSLSRLNAFKIPKLSLPRNLLKLDLKCFPRRSARTSVRLESGELKALTWLEPSNLQNLKKLYIRGGELRDLGQLGHWGNHSEVETGTNLKWNVKTLRLKYLTELEMDWTELQELFPELKCLEKVKCPKLTMFPCNAHGVWKDKEKTSLMLQ